jgi:carbamoyltransferase
MNNISIHGSHNAAISFNIENTFYIIEIERFIGYKNAGLAQYKPILYADIVIKQILDFIRSHYGISEFDTCVTSNTHNISIENGLELCNKYEQNIPCKNYIHGLTHHYLHTYSTFYQSPYFKNLIISFDGGGDDGFFNIYKWNRDESEPTLIKQYPYDLGSYMIFAHYLEPIKQEHSISEGNLVYSGKLMGLCGYGKIIKEWVEHFKIFYKTPVYTLSVEQKIQKLSEKINIKFDQNNRLVDQLAYDIAATAQYAFECVFFDLCDEIINLYENDYAICLVGGCAMNVLLNTSIKQKYNNPVYITPNATDCGISLGGLFYSLRPLVPVNIIYSGIPILDIDSIGTYTYEHSYTCNIKYNPSISYIAELLSQGKIIGIMRETSEHGPRALGNRSILCDPTYPNIKTILNQKIKHREWYRPFAPVVKKEIANKYFDILEDSPYMSFAFAVKEEYRQILSSITHIDNTARVQTLARDTNPWLYDLLSEIEKINTYPILLNTSFNINGKPIVSSIKEAFYLLDNTDLDGLLIEQTLFIKKNKIQL